MVTNPSTNRARRRATTLIETNALLLSQAITNRAQKACTKTITPINVKFKGNVGTIKFDYWMQYYDVITNPRWRTADNMKIVMLSYLSEK